MKRRENSKQPVSTKSELLLFNKPFGVLCQFTDDLERVTLAHYLDAPGYYPAGRLDRDSEGLMLLTNNGRLQQKISDPKFHCTKRYLVQVDGQITDTALQALETGVALKDGPARALRAYRVECPDALWPRDPPVRYRQHIPTSWVEIELQEGRNRQVRRMTAAVGFPTLRLVRVSIANLEIWSLAPGEHRFVPAHNLIQ